METGFTGEEEATASAVTTSSSVSATDGKKPNSGTSTNEKRRSKVTVDWEENGGKDADESVSKKRKPSGAETPMTPGAGDFGGVHKLPARRKKVNRVHLFY